jgi:hypothetical protein
MMNILFKKSLKELTERIIATNKTHHPGGEILQAYMLPPKEQFQITESYVSIPPALTITDSWGNIWTLGTQFSRMDDAPNGEFAFNILRNGIEMGVSGSRIERRNGKIRVFTRQGWLTWNERAFI